jgi:hypothetical protein
MPELKDLDEKLTALAALRKLIALGRPGGYTPLEVVQLQRECQRLWAQVETRRREELTGLLPSQPIGKPREVA